MSLGTFIKRMRDITRLDQGINGDAQRIEQLTWMLFLKIYDDKEYDWEAMDEDYESIIPEECYEINVEEAGIYELAIHQRMESGTEHGAKLTVNEGSANEYSIQTSYQFATDEELLYVCNNQNVMSSYMLGIRLELVKGINEIKIEVASNTDEGQYFRDFYLVKILE